MRNKNDKVRVKVGGELSKQKSEENPGFNASQDVSGLNDDNSALENSGDNSFFVNNGLSKSQYMPRTSDQSDDSRFNMDYFDPPVLDYVPLM